METTLKQNQPFSLAQAYPPFSGDYIHQNMCKQLKT